MLWGGGGGVIMTLCTATHRWHWFANNGDDALTHHLALVRLFRFKVIHTQHHTFHIYCCFLSSTR